MAGLTKEQRAVKQAEQEAKLKAEIEEKIRNEVVAQPVIDASKSNKKKSISTDYMIPVKSGVNGILVYVSKKTFGYEVEWNNFGDIEYIEYSELLSMRNTTKAFFENNWIYFEDTDDYTAQELYEALRVDRYYKNTVLGKDINSIFDKTPDEIQEIITPLSKGIKETIALTARAKIDAGELDSIKRIETLEKSLNVELRPSY